jgi:PAS domain S-box-containing protein
MNVGPGIQPSEEIASPGKTGLRRIVHPSISKKFLVLFSVLVLSGLGNWLVVESTLSKLSGAAAVVNVTGNLRWISQRIQLDTVRIALGQGGSRADLEATFDRLDESIRALGQGGNAHGFVVRQLPENLQSAIEAIRIAVIDYRKDTAALLDKLPTRRNVSADLDHLYLDGTYILNAADVINAILTTQAAEIESDAMRNLGRLALLDLSILIAALLAIRIQIVHPLRKLAVVSRQFANGRHDKRAAVNSRDEIGQLATAFNHMADQIECDVRRISDDVRQLKDAELSLRKLSQAVEHSPASVVITDPAGRIEYVNPKFCEITGYARGEVAGNTPAILKSSLTPAGTYQDLWRTILSGCEWRGELLNRKKNGDLFWENTLISPLKDDQGAITHFIAVKEDITERKRAEEEIGRLNASLEQRVAERTRQLAASNKELESFSYSISHDLRAPLRGINGFAHLMEESCHGCTKTDAVGYLSRIQRASTRMGDLIDGMLDLARITRTRIDCQPTDLSDMVRMILDDLADAEPDRQVQVEVQEGIAADADATLLRNVLQNLLGNAWKFTAKHGKARIAFGCRQENDEAVYFISDNGAGFDMRYADKLFGAFQRLHGPQEFDGTGIGLATAQRIIHLHGGRIWAEGQPGKGATFYFTLPDSRDGR